MSDLYVLDPVLRALKGDIQAADPISGIAIHAMKVPFAKPMPDEITDIHGHGDVLEKRTALRKQELCFGYAQGKPLFH
jgi:hypothetical protein